MEVSALALMLTAAVWLVLRNGHGALHALAVRAAGDRHPAAIRYGGALRDHPGRAADSPEGNSAAGTWSGGWDCWCSPSEGRRWPPTLYYGQWLPNTYYLKLEGWPFALRILRGLYALVWFIYYSNWIVFLLPLTLLLFRRDWKVTLPLGA